MGNVADIDESTLNIEEKSESMGEWEGRSGKEIAGKETVFSVELPEGYLEKLERKRYSRNTIKAYVAYIRNFAAAFQGRDLADITREEINSYILGLIREKRISPSQQNQRINAIKFYYEKVLGREKAYYDIERPRGERKLPTVLSQDEFNRILSCIRNIKHKCI
ncbi:MAG: phage integrase N-terminal SAM-like domain-containing protein [Bacteroidales bacterium]|nr:phage integrase N-terminal SAM-like domain-containing protein [Bacteroidales bacterium]